jgi:hypothetical protein
LRLCEQYGGEVFAMSIAKEDEKEAIHTALAMGCKEAIRIDASNIAELDTLVSAQLLAARSVKAERWIWFAWACKPLTATMVCCLPKPRACWVGGWFLWSQR